MKELNTSEIEMVSGGFDGWERALQRLVKSELVSLVLV